MKNIPFEVVMIYKNYDPYTPYTLKKLSNKSEAVYAVKIADDFFILGEKGCGVYLCDYTEEE